MANTRGLAVDHRPRTDQDDCDADRDQSRRSQVCRSVEGRGGNGSELAIRTDAGSTGDRRRRWPRLRTCWLIRDRQPVFFHCVAGHHRSKPRPRRLPDPACGWSAAAAWKEVASLPWARPASTADQNDKALIEEFARVQNVVQAAGAGHERSRSTMTNRSRIASDRQMHAAAGRVDFVPRLVTWPGTRRHHNFGQVQPAESIDQARCPRRR